MPIGAQFNGWSLTACIGSLRHAPWANLIYKTSRGGADPKTQDYFQTTLSVIEPHLSYSVWSFPCQHFFVINIRSYRLSSRWIRTSEAKLSLYPVATLVWDWSVLGTLQGWWVTGRMLVVLFLRVGTSRRQQTLWTVCHLPCHQSLVLPSWPGGILFILAIRETTLYKGGEVWELDLSNFESIKLFADKFEREGGGKLDLLIENSAISTRSYSTTKDGWEST